MTSLAFKALTTTLPTATEIHLSATAGDFTEGFPHAYPALPGTFSKTIFQSATVLVAEPTLSGTLLLGLATLDLIKRYHLKYAEHKLTDSKTSFNVT